MWRNIKNNHFLMMVLCCAAPIAVISLLAAGGILGSWGYLAIFLLCPLLHVFMMRNHSARHGGREGAEHPLFAKDALEDSFEDK